MKTLVVICGQSRQIAPSFELHFASIREFLTPFNPTYILTTWDEPYAKDVLSSIEFAKIKLISPDSFDDVKQGFWNKYKSLQPDANIAASKFAHLLALNKRYGSNCDNLLRMSYLLYEAKQLSIGMEFDRILKIRPDTVIRYKFDLPCYKDKITCPVGHMSDDVNKRYVMSDQVFWGFKEEMYRFMDLFVNLPAYAVKYESGARSAFNAGTWLISENVHRQYAELMCNLAISGEQASVSVHRGDPTAFRPLSAPVSIK